MLTDLFAGLLKPSTPAVPTPAVPTPAVPTPAVPTPAAQPSAVPPLTTLPDPPPLSPAQEKPWTGAGLRVGDNLFSPDDQHAGVVTGPAPDDMAVALEADAESLLERAAIMEHDGDLPQDEAVYHALSCARFRVWRLTLDDGSTCIQIDPDAPTLAEFQPLPALAYRVVDWEPVVASILLDRQREG